MSRTLLEECQLIIAAQLRSEPRKKQEVRIDAQAAGVAAYDMVQNNFLLPIERGVLCVDDARVILRDSIESQASITDAQRAPLAEGAALLLTRFSEAVQRQIGSNLASVRLDGR